MNPSLATIAPPVAARAPATPGHLERLVTSTPGALLVAACLIAVASSPVFLRTFINDDATYALIAAKLGTGHLLYRDAVDNKPPLIYGTFAAVFALCGAGNVAAVKALSILVNVACAGLVFLIGRPLLGRQVAAVASLLFACAVTSGIAEDSIAPNSEGFMSLFALLSFWLVCRGRAPRPALLVVSGACAGVAVLYRVQGLGVVVGVACALWRQTRRSPGRREALVAFLCGVLLPLGAVGAHLARRGTLDELWRWVITNNVAAVQAGGADGVTLSKVGRVALAAASQAPLILAVAAGVRRLRAGTTAERHALGAIVVQLLVALAWYPVGNRFFGHYLIPGLPFAALLGAWGLLAAPVRRLRLVIGMALFWSAAFAAYNGARLARPAEPPALARVVAYVGHHTGPRDQLLLWGASPALALASGRDFATRFPFNNYLTGRIFGTSHVSAGATRAGNATLENPAAWALFWRDLTARPPRLVIDGAAVGFGVAAYPELASYLASHYQPPVALGEHLLYLRKSE
jgi:hypothetical protein